MTEYRWVRATTCDRIPLREGRMVVVGGREIAIFNLGDRFLATSNRCPHRAGPLSDGIVVGASVVCPLHAWKISLTSGGVERPAGSAAPCIDTFPVKVLDEIVLVGLPISVDRAPGPRTGAAPSPATCAREGHAA